MTRKYWLDLFTGTTWEEFLEHGAKISGFRIVGVQGQRIPAFSKAG